MKVILLFITCFSLIPILHTYLFYPLICFILSKYRKANFETYNFTDELPFVSFIMPLHNEEKVLQEKIKSLNELNYPTDKIKWFIGSDASTDKTNEILKQVSAHHNVYFIDVRTGKPGMVNFLVNKAFEYKAQGSGHILLFTDASVMLHPDCLFMLIKFFKGQKIGLVDANMVNKGVTNANISFAESKYVSFEVKLKHWESILNQKMIGPFGGCFALRSNYFTPIPDNFLVDDFFLCMEVFKKNGNAINSLEAISYESVSQEITEEFRRKSRIAAGNLQNKHYFDDFLKGPLLKIAFFIYSHKVFRWYVPAFVAILLISITGLSFIQPKPFLYILVSLILTIFGIPFVESILSKLKIVISPIKSLNYFIRMNFALLKGFIDYYKGIKSNVWQPTKRY